VYLDSADSQWFVIANLKRPISPDSLIQSTQFQAEETNKKGTPPGVERALKKNCCPSLSVFVPL